MKDKIFVHLGHHLGLMQATNLETNSPSEEEYVKKAAIIEELARIEKEVETDTDKMDSWDRGFLAALDAINSFINRP